jgi:hypothetical protein
METLFDKFKMHEKPYLVLCNPDGKQIHSLDMATNVELSFKYNAVSEIKFNVQKIIDGKYNPVFPYISSKRYILLENYGYFVITNPNSNDDGNKNIKSITGLSVEIELNYKHIVDYAGTKTLTALLNELIVNFPNWTLGYIDPAVANISRTFDISDATIYNFLMTDVETAYNCIFIFDPLNRIINVYSRANATTDTSIYLSFDNVIKNLDISEKTDELTTCFHVKGKDSLDIRTVNPTGTDTIHDFSYFKNDSWMDKELQLAIDLWQDYIDYYRTPYADKLILLMQANEVMVDLQADLTDLTNQLNTQNALLQLRIQNGQVTTDIVDAINALSILIDAKEIEIADQQMTIDAYSDDLKTINDICRIENNFTEAQYKILSSYIIENSYTNDAFVQTDTMTYTQTKNMSMDLYNYAKDVLARISQPRIEFSLQSANFIFIEKFKPLTAQLVLGAKISIEIEEGNVIYPNLLQIELNYDEPDKFDLTFGNALRLDDPSFVYSDLYGQTIKAIGRGGSGNGSTETITTGPAAENRILYFSKGIYKGFVYN